MKISQWLFDVSFKHQFKNSPEFPSGFSFHLHPKFPHGFPPPPTTTIPGDSPQNPQDFACLEVGSWHQIARQISCITQLCNCYSNTNNKMLIHEGNSSISVFPLLIDTSQFYSFCSYNQTDIDADNTNNSTTTPTPVSTVLKLTEVVQWIVLRLHLCDHFINHKFDNSVNEVLSWFDINRLVTCQIITYKTCLAIRKKFHIQLDLKFANATWSLLLSYILMTCCAISY